MKNRRRKIRRGLWVVAGMVVLAAGVSAALWFPWPNGSTETASPDTSATMGSLSGETDSGAIPYQNLFQVFWSGGVLMIPIFVGSVTTVLFFFERLAALRSARIIPRPFVRRLLLQLREGQLTRDEALELCEQERSPVAVVFQAALKKWGRPAVEVEQAVLDEGERIANQLRKHLRVFHGVATISPLLGLLGTVCGMIQAFNAIAQTEALGRTEMLAAGISQALLTTAAGLCVAIPALSFHLFFVSRVDRLVMKIDALGQQLVEIIAEDAGPALAKSTSKTRKATTTRTKQAA